MKKREQDLGTETAPPEPPPGGGREGRSPARRWAVRAGMAAAGLAALYGGLALLFGLLLEPERVSAWLEPRLEAAVNRPVELRGARPTFFPGLGVDLTGLRVGNPPGFEGPPLVLVERVGLRIALLPLLTGTIRVDEVRVRSPRVRLATGPEGTSNYRDLVTASSPTEEGSSGGPLQIRVRDLRLTDGRIVYSSARDSTYGALYGVRASASLQRGADGAWTVDLESRAGDVELSHPAIGGDTVALSGPGFSTRAAVGPEGEWLELGQGELRVGDAALRLTGRVDGLTDPDRSVDLALQADGLAVERLASVLPDSLRERVPGRPSGELDVELTARGPAGPDGRPEIRGRVDVERFGLGAGEEDELIREMAGTIRIRGDSLRIQELAGTVLGGPLALHASLLADSLLSLRGRVEARPDLGRIRRVMSLPEGVDVRGRAEVATGFVGSARRPANVRLDGVLRLRGMEVRHPRFGVPLAVEEAEAELAGSRVTWSDVSVRLGDEVARVSGELTDALAMEPDGRGPALRADVSSSRLTLDRIVPPRGDPEMTYGRIAFAHLGGRELDGREPGEVARSRGFSRPGALPLTVRIEAAVDTLVAEPYRLSGARFPIEGGEALLQVPEASFELFGGRVRSSLRLGLGPDPRQPFDLTLSVDGSRAGDFLSRVSPLGRTVRGRLSLDLRAAGALDTLLLPVETILEGEGRFDVVEGSLTETPVTALLARTLSLPGLASPGFRDLGVSFELEGGRILFDEGRLTTEVGELIFGGAVGLGGSLDLGIRLSASGGALDSLALERAGLASAVAERLAGSSLVQVGLRLGGTLQDPTLRPDASLAVGSLRDAVGDELRERIGGARDTVTARLQGGADSAVSRTRRDADRARERLEGRARNLLRSLIGGEDSAAAAPGVPDSFPVPSDTSGADTLSPPDTAAPDTAGLRSRDERAVRRFVPLSGRSRWRARLPSSAPFLRRSPSRSSTRDR